MLACRRFPLFPHRTRPDARSRGVFIRNSLLWRALHMFLLFIYYNKTGLRQWNWSTLIRQGHQESAVCSLNVGVYYLTCAWCKTIFASCCAYLCLHKITRKKLKTCVCWARNAKPPLALSSSLSGGGGATFSHDPPEAALHPLSLFRKHAQGEGHLSLLMPPNLWQSANSSRTHRQTLS
jgi:hypothetical protein